MQILQISDLHFGKHSDPLKDALSLRVKEIRPDVIVATGDLVDTPKAQLFTEAYRFLDDLGKACPDSDLVPPILVVPGNHDIWHTGLFGGPFRPEYSSYFGRFASNHYFKAPKVWIWGFDSASKRKLATGEVLEQELVRFHKDYETLKKADTTFAAEVFKIVIIHHHPLPVNWETDWQQRLLMMTNAGTFLSAMLSHNINLVLHGHEHLQGRSRLSSSLGGDGDAELVVVSLGATLRKVANPNRNWFNIITLGPPGDPTGRPVTVESISSVNQLSFAERGEVYTVQSAQQGRETAFHIWRKESGFVYSEVASITDLNFDGDCHRVVECEQMQILSHKSSRCEKHEIDLPHTSGYFDLKKVTVDPNCHYPGIYLETSPSDGTLRQTEHVTIRWGKGVKLGAGDTISYEYQWWALNSFAMDGHQFRRKYKEPPLLEFTHFPVTDPITDLLVVVRFPRGFVPATQPQIRVTRTDSSQTDNRLWERVGDLERELRARNALRFLESLGVAALRVHMPQKGYCYGIEWGVPDKGSEKVDLKIEQLKNDLLRASEDDAKAPVLAILAEELGRTTLQELLPTWKGHVEIVCMLFDENQRKLRGVSAATVTPQGIVPLDKRHIEFDYGVGIAGRAFKGNEGRLYIHREIQNRSVPNHYVLRSREEPQAVLVCLPLRSPDGEYIFGVLNVASDDPACPLAKIAEMEGPIPEEKILNFLNAVNSCIVASMQVLAIKEVI